MANEQNLKPFTSDQSREEAKKNGAKGGVASGIARKKKRALKNTIEMIMRLGVDPQTQSILEQLGVPEEDQSVQTAIVVAQAMKAMRGDTKAADYLGKYASADPRIFLEQERIALERERLAMRAEADAPDDNETEDVVIYLPDNGRDE